MNINLIFIIAHLFGLFVFGFGYSCIFRDYFQIFFIVCILQYIQNVSYTCKFFGLIAILVLIFACFPSLYSHIFPLIFADIEYGLQFASSF